jgi:hypothetical protein
MKKLRSALLLPAALLTACGPAPVEAEARTPSSAGCTDIKSRSVYALGVGTHVLTFGPASQTQVSLVLEEVAHSHGG